MIRLFFPIAQVIRTTLFLEFRIILNRCNDRVDATVVFSSWGDGDKTKKKKQSRNYVPYTYQYTNETIDIEEEMRVKLIALPAAEYEGVLRPAFQEDEIKLILVGALLGAGAGALQGLLISL